MVLFEQQNVRGAVFRFQTIVRPPFANFGIKGTLTNLWINTRHQ